MKIVEAKHSDINLKKSYNVVRNQYLSGDVYDFNAPTYEQDDTYTTVDANGFIMDKQGNKYPVKGSHNTEDAGRIVGGASRTIVKIYYGEEVLRWEHYLGAFSSYNDGNGGIFASLEQGIYLEDFCAKFPNGDPRKLIAQIAEGGSKDALTQRVQGVVDRKNRYFSIAESATTFLVKDGKISTVEGRSYKTNHWSYGGAVKEDERYKDLTPEQISVVIKNIDDSLNVNGYNLYDFDGAIIKVLPKSYSYNRGVFDSKTGDFRSSYGFEDVVDGTYSDWNKYKKYVNNKGFKREKREYDKLVISEIDIKNTPFYDQICEIVKKSRKLGRREFIDKKVKNRGWRDSIAKAREGAISEYDDETNLLLRGNLPWNMFVEAIEQLPAKVLDNATSDESTTSQGITPKNASDRDYAKMTAWHNGERRENIKACSPEKLIMYRNICTELGYQEQVDLINAELSSRGINESVKSENLIDTEYSHTKDIAKDKEYFKNKYEKKGYKNIRVKKVKSDTKGLPMYEIYGDKEVNESLNESNDEDMGYKLGKWLGARLMTKWTAMLNVEGAEESPDYYEYDQQFDGNFVECLKKLEEYQNLIDQDGIEAYLALENWQSGEYFQGDYDRIIEDLIDRGYLYESDLEESDDMDESLLNESKPSYNCCGIRISLPELRNRTEQNCKILSDNGDEIDYGSYGTFTTSGLCNDFWGYFDTNSEFEKLAKKYAGYVGPVFDSDRKAAAFIFAVDELYPEIWDAIDSYTVNESLEESFSVSDETIEDAIEYYRENAFGFDGLKNYVETDFSHLPKEARDEIYKKMKKRLGESLNESAEDNIGNGLFLFDFSCLPNDAPDIYDDLCSVFGGSNVGIVEEMDYSDDYITNYPDIFQSSVQYKPGDGEEAKKSVLEILKNHYAVLEGASWETLGESLNENCNSYSYKGKTIINAGDYWFVKGYKEKFPTSDEAEEFIDDKKKDEGMKINIKESLNKMDAESDNTYDLLNLYESKNLSKNQKKDIARMIYENYGLEKIYKYLYEATEEGEDELPVEDRVKELTNNFKNTNGSYVFEDWQDANKAVTILKSRGYDASQKRTQDNKYRVTAEKKNK